MCRRNRFWRAPARTDNRWKSCTLHARRTGSSSRSSRSRCTPCPMDNRWSHISNHPTPFRSFPKGSIARREGHKLNHSRRLLRKSPMHSSFLQCTLYPNRPGQAPRPGNPRCRGCPKPRRPESILCRRLFLRHLHRPRRHPSRSKRRDYCRLLRRTMIGGWPIRTPRRQPPKE